MDTSRRSFLTLAAGGVAGAVLGLPAAEAATASPAAAYRVVRRFALSPDIAGASSKAEVAPRRGGGFAALWEQAPASGAPSGLFRHFGDAGRPLSKAVRLTVDTQGDERIGSVVPQPDGTTAVFTFGRVAKDATGALWWMQRFDGRGRRIGRRRLIAPGTRGDHHFAVRLADGRMIAAWRDDDVLGNLAATVDPSGRVLARTRDRLFHNWVEGLAPLPRAAGAVMAYYTGGGEVAFQIVDPGLAPKGDPILFRASNSYEGVVVAPHPAGFVAAWTGFSDATGDAFVDGAVMSAAGTVLARFRPVALAPGLDMNNGFDMRGALLALPDGRLLFARNRRALDRDGRDLFQILLHLYGKDGARLAPAAEIVRDTSRLGELFTRVAAPRSMVRLKGGTILLAYDRGPFFGPQAEAVTFRVR